MRISKSLPFPVKLESLFKSPDGNRQGSTASLRPVLRWGSDLRRFAVHESDITITVDREVAYGGSESNEN